MNRASSPEGARRFTPLWPAGHLPHKGEKGCGTLLALTKHSAFSDLSVEREAAACILPLVGEMAGRPEGVSGPLSSTQCQEGKHPHADDRNSTSRRDAHTRRDALYGLVAQCRPHRSLPVRRSGQHRTQPPADAARRRCPQHRAARHSCRHPLRLARRGGLLAGPRALVRSVETSGRPLCGATRPALSSRPAADGLRRGDGGPRAEGHPDRGETARAEAAAISGRGG